MSDWNEYPGFEQALAQRIAAKKAEQTSQPTSTPSFDPYKMMMMKKDVEDGKPVDTSNVVKWPEEDVKRLEDFCKKYGIVGFNCGRMSPAAALHLLKSKLGVLDASPVEVARGRYEDRMSQKTLLKG